MKQRLRRYFIGLAWKLMFRSAQASPAWRWHQQSCTSTCRDAEVWPGNYVPCVVGREILLGGPQYDQPSI